MSDNKNNTFIEKGEMRELIRNKDWGQTPLGAQRKWPQSLQTVVDLILESDFPMIVRWGDELAQIYNDSYRVILQDKHPEGLGQPTKECWSEVWEFNQPIFNRVFEGKTITLKDQLFTINRREPDEDAWFTLCYSPIRNDSDDIAGVLVTVFETTERLKAEKRLQKREEQKSFMLQFEDDIQGLEDPRKIMQKAAESVGQHLEADRAGYAEIDETGEYLIVKTDWTSDKVPSLEGKVRVDDFGPKFKEELKAGNLISFDDHLNSVFTEGVESNYEEFNNRACIKAPIMRAGEFKALFFVHQSESREWTVKRKKAGARNGHPNMACRGTNEGRGGAAGERESAALSG